MAVNITITGDNAEDALNDLAKLSAALNRPRVEGRVAQISPEVNEVRMAASVEPPEQCSPDTVAIDAPTEEKPARRRRTKAEMEAARRAGEPPQDGDPDLDPEDTEPVPNAETQAAMVESETVPGERFATVADVMNDLASDEPAVHTPTREETSKLMLTVLNNKWRTAAQLKALFAEIGGEGVTNLTTMADPFIPVAYERMAAITGPLPQ